MSDDLAQLLTEATEQFARFSDENFVITDDNIDEFEGFVRLWCKLCRDLFRKYCSTKESLTQYYAKRSDEVPSEEDEAIRAMMERKLRLIEMNMDKMIFAERKFRQASVEFRELRAAEIAASAVAA